MLYLLFLLLLSISYQNAVNTKIPKAFILVRNFEHNFDNNLSNYCSFLVHGKIPIFSHLSVINELLNFSFDADLKLDCKKLEMAILCNFQNNNIK